MSEELCNFIHFVGRGGVSTSLSLLRLCLTFQECGSSSLYITGTTQRCVKDVSIVSVERYLHRQDVVGV